MTEKGEDKKCRICGLADAANLNLFSSGNSKVLSKVQAVYPIVLYKDDPLPKNICKKCLSHVNSMYNDIERVMRTQNKWISTVRSIAPNHAYIRLLENFETFSKTTRAAIHNIHKKDIREQGIKRLLLWNKSDDFSSIFDADNTADVKVGNEIAKLDKHSNLNTANNDDCTKTHKIEHAKPQTSFKDEDELTLSEIANLEMSSNLKKSSLIACAYCALKFSTKADLAKHQQIHINLCLRPIFEKKCLGKDQRRGRLITVGNTKSIRCLNCWRLFANNKLILDHWSTSVCDFYCLICGKEYVQAPKELRQHISDEHGINYRCLKTIYENMRQKETNIADSTDAGSSTECTDINYTYLPPPSPPKLKQCKKKSRRSKSKECEVTKPTADAVSNKPKPSSAQQKQTDRGFPCPICSKSFQSPPLRTAHMRVHRDSYAKGLSGVVRCTICFKTFQNYKARNSHMRKHKPSFVFGSVVSPINAVKDDDYTEMESDDCANSTGDNATISMDIDEDNKTTIDIKPPPTDNNCHFMANLIDKTPVTTTAATTHTTTATTVATATIIKTEVQSNVNLVSSQPKSTVIRGVRTKFVTRRNDINPLSSLSSSSSITNTAPAVVKVKALSDLQSSSKISAMPCLDWTVLPTTVPMKFENSIKDEPLENDPISVTLDIYTCPSCGLHFTTHNEMFEHECGQNSLFANVY